MFHTMPHPGKHGLKEKDISKGATQRLLVHPPARKPCFIFAGPPLYSKSGFLNHPFISELDYAVCACTRQSCMHIRPFDGRSKLFHTGKEICRAFSTEREKDALIRWGPHSGPSSHRTNQWSLANFSCAEPQ
jgi:hypothetical protein